MCAHKEVILLDCLYFIQGINAAAATSGGVEELFPESVKAGFSSFCCL